MLRLTLRTAAMAPLIIVAALTFGAHTAAAQGQVPAMIAGVPNERDNQDLFDHADQWPTARRYVGRIIHADHSLDQVSDAQLAGWLTQLKSWGIGLELEVGVIKAWAKDSHDAFDKDDRNWQRVIRLGGTISSIAMDEPLGAARADHRISLTDQQAVEETAQFIELVRQHYPAGTDRRHRAISAYIAGCQPLVVGGAAEQACLGARAWSGFLQDRSRLDRVSSAWVRIVAGSPADSEILQLEQTPIQPDLLGIGLSEIEPHAPRGRRGMVYERHERRICVCGGWRRARPIRAGKLDPGAISDCARRR